MRLLDIRGALRRRWYVLLAGSLATFALAVLAFVRIGPTQEVRASALLLPPTVSVVTPAPSTPVNPFLRLDGIDPALDVLVTKLMAEDFSDRILEDAPRTEYTVAQDPLSQAPVVVVTASGSDAEEAAIVLDRVTKEMPKVFDDLQAEAGVRTSARISLVPLVRDQAPEVVYGGLLRIEILLLGVGMVGTLLIAGFWDALSRSRAAVRASHQPSPQAEPAAAGPAAARPAAAEPAAAGPAAAGPAAARPAAARPAAARPVAARSVAADPDEPAAPAPGPSRPAVPRSASPRVNQSRKARKTARKRASNAKPEPLMGGGDAVQDDVPESSDSAEVTAT